MGLTRGSAPEPNLDDSPGSSLGDRLERGHPWPITSSADAALTARASHASSVGMACTRECVRAARR